MHAIKAANAKISPLIKSRKSAKEAISCRTQPDEKHENWLQKSLFLFRHNPASIVLLRLPEKKYIDVNETVLRTFGFSRQEVIGKTGDELDIFVEQDKRQIAQTQLTQQGYVEIFEMKFRRKDKTILDGLFSAEIIQHREKRYILVVITDITSRNLKQQTQRENEEKYRTILETTEGYYEIDLAGNFTFFNNSVCTLLGYSENELRGMNNRQYTSRETARKVFQAFNKVYRTGQPTKEFDWEIIRKDGTKRYIEQSASLKKDVSGKPIGFRGIIHDITERKQMEDALRKSEENFRHSLDDSPLGVRIVTEEGETLYANQAILDMYGYTCVDELKNTPLHKRYTAESYADFQLRQEKRLKGESGPPEYEISIVRKDGEVRHVLALRKDIFWNRQKQYQIIYQDTTERRKAECKLRETLYTLRKSINTTIQVLSIASEARDPYTAGHQRRVADLARHRNGDETAAR